MTHLRAVRARTFLVVVAVLVTASACSTDDGHLPRTDAGRDTRTDAGDGGATTSVVVMPPAAPARTTEGGGEVGFYVSLGRAPTADVVVPLTSSKPGEGKVTPASLTFTTANWRAPQKVTVTGVDDPSKDGDQPYIIAVGPATSTDTRFLGLSGWPVALTNLDDEMAGLVVSTPSNATTEAGIQARFTVVLQSKPAGEVSVAVTSDDPGEGVVSPAALAFTPDNWNAPQTVTVTGVDDGDIDGRVDYTVTVGPVTGADPTYTALASMKVQLANVDNDSPGISVVSMANLTTSEAGVTAEIAVVLNARPTADVTVPVSSSDAGEGTVTPASLTFTSTNWNAPQGITVTGVNDDVADGNQMFTVVVGAATSADRGYAGIDPEDVTVTNTDNDSAGFTVSPVAGLETTEGGGTATFTVVLNSRPAADVTIALTSSDTSEGTVAPGSLTFTPANWNAPRAVTITGVNDDVADGNQTYTIVTAAAVSGDAAYMGLDPANVTGVSNVDNDSAGITVAAAAGIGTTEGGGTATFTVVLNSRPAADVTVALTSSDTSEGTVAPAALTFTTANWNAPQTVTATGVNDDLADGAQPYIIVTAAAVSTDVKYAGIDAANVTLTNADNDSAGITVTPTTGLTTTEGGMTASFTVVLNSQPTANVVIGVTSGDTTEGTVAPATLTFTPMNWNAPQAVTVTGVNDDVADGNQTYSILTAAATSTDGAYGGLDPANVSVSNTDNDSAGITVTPTTGLTTTEGGGTATFTVVLNSQPTANVVIALTSSDTGEGTVAPGSLTFTPMNWASPQTVTVTGVNDDVADGNQPYVIQTAAAVSTDTGYGGLDAANAAVNNTDNDSAGITVTPTAGLMTTEGGGTAMFTVVLNSQPMANVVIGVSSSDSGEGTITSAATLTFTATNWATPQTVTVQGVNDDLDDGNQPFTIVTAPAISVDAGYAGMDAMNVAASNTDNDTAGFTVSMISGPTSEGLATATFTIRLNSQPTASVDIALSSDDPGEGTVVTASPLTFTTANWMTDQTVTVRGVDDAVADGNPTYHIVTAAAVTSDTTGYAGLNPPDVTVTNTDNDTAGITVSAISGHTTEMGLGTASFTIVLDTQPTGTVTIGVSSDDITEGMVTSGASVTFDGSNWSTPQMVTVQGVNDDLDDGNVTYHVVTAPATGSDTSGYVTKDAADVIVINDDDDMAGFTISAISGPTTEAGMGTATFTVKLNAQPSDTVTIAVSSDDTSEGTVPPATSLVFTGSNWSMNQTVTVTGADDAVPDGNVPYHIVLGTATSADPAYSMLDPADVAVTNDDNEVAPTEIRLFSAGPRTGDVGNRAAVDLICNTAASGWALGKTIHAFISVDTSDEIQDLPGHHPWLPTAVPINDLTGAHKVADSWADLLDGNIDADLATAGVTTNGWWSFSLANGALAGATCLGGTDGSLGQNGQSGVSVSTGGTWLSNAATACINSYDLLCIAY